MESFEFPTTASRLAASLGAPLIGDGHAEINKIGALNRAGKGVLSFLSHKKYQRALEQVKDAVIVTTEDLVQADLSNTYIVVSEPQLIFAKVAKQFRRQVHSKGISPLASIDPSAVLEKGVSVGAYTIIGKGAKIGANTTLFPNTYIGPGVIIGKECEIHPRVTLWDEVTIGDRVKIFAGTVIGSEGFGFIESQSHEFLEMPQVGTVVIENDVRIGANCTIDRATLGETRIGQGTKIDNLVHIAHNDQIGKNVILCAQVGLSGTVTIEDEAILGGQVGIGQGVTVGKRARMGGQSGSSSNVKGNNTYFLTPATPIKETVKIVKYLRKLPEMWERLKKLENKGGESEHSPNRPR